MNWMKFKSLYFILSAIVISVGIYSIVNFGLPLGVDFKGGTVVEYKTEKQFSTEQATQEVEKLEVQVTALQRTSDNTYIFRLNSIDDTKRKQIQEKLQEISQGSVEELRFENVGPSVGPELIKKTAIALLISAGCILLWIAYQFKSLQFGVSAVLAMFHDTFVLVGTFTLLGHLYKAEIDFLFVTALLTTLSFSVHDTIVVYDRIREIRRKHGGEIKEIANKAISETMRRSINNSLTIVFMLVALIVLGGTTIKWFAVALLIGTISGTYSSPFVAVPLLVTWGQIRSRLRKNN